MITSLTPFSLSRACGQAAALVVLTWPVQQAAAACYEIYSSDNQLMYRSMRSPVDLSKQLHETVPGQLPGGTLVFMPSSQGCEIEYNKLQQPMVIDLQGAGVTTIRPRETPTSRKRS